MQKNNILLILIPSFIFVLAWIGFSIYHNVVTSTISNYVSVQISAITPTFDTNTIQALKNRKNVIPLYALNATGNTTAPQASPSATPLIINTTLIPVGNSTNSAATSKATNGGVLIQ